MAELGEIPQGDREQSFQHETSERREFSSYAARIRSTEEFHRTVGAYRSSLNKAVESRHITEIQDPLSRLASRAQRQAEDTASDQPRDDQTGKDISQIYGWFKEHFGGATTLVEQYLPKDYKGADPQKRAAYQEMVATNLAQWYLAERGLDKAQREALKNQALVQTAQFMLAEATYFKPVQELLDTNGGRFDEQNWAHNKKMLEGVVIAAKIEAETESLTREAKTEMLRSWLIQTADEARVGRELPDGSWEKRKIYETPYYESILDELELRSTKRNGVGGQILYGPPGTGKTELVIEKNRRQGYETHVVNLHKYTTFADLIAERQLTVNVDPNVTLVDKLGKIADQFKNGTADEFRDAITEAYRELGARGKLDDQSLGEFLKPMLAQTDGLTDAILSDPEQIGQNWDVIRKAFIAKQQAKIALASSDLPQYNETVDDIVRGEILLAIRRSKGTGKKIRVLLDELDKAGPSAHGGLLTILAKSPGETISIGNAKEEIPDWFTVDATSNAQALNEYLRNRFSEIHIGTPPPKDQLMIATARLIDKEGVVQLSDYEQEQFAAFFMYVVPRVNELLEKAEGASPISNRDIQELTSNLVNYDNRERTGLSVEDAMRQIIINNSAFTGDKALQGRVEEVLTRFDTMIHDKGLVIEDLFDTGSASETEGDITAEPLLHIINGLDSGISKTRVNSVKRVQLNARQQQMVKAHMGEQQRKHEGMRNVIVLPTGIEIEASDGRVRYQAIPHQEDNRVTHKLYDIPAGGRLIAASTDGTVLAMQSEPESISLVRPFDPGTDDEGHKTYTSDTISVHPGNYHLNSDGTYFMNTGTNGEMLLLNTTSPINKNSVVAASRNAGITDFRFSADGARFLGRVQSGDTYLIDTATNRKILESALPKPQDGYTWQFVGAHVIAQVASDGSAVDTKALYVA